MGQQSRGRNGDQLGVVRTSSGGIRYRSAFQEVKRTASTQAHQPPTYPKFGGGKVETV